MPTLKLKSYSEYFDTIFQHLTCCEVLSKEKEILKNFNSNLISQQFLRTKLL